MKNVWNFQVFEYNCTNVGGVYSLKADFPEKYIPLIHSLAPVLRSCYFRSLLMIDADEKTELFIGRNRGYKCVPYFLKVRKLGE